MASVKKLKVNKWKGRNRLEGLKKKFGQLTTLCDVDGFLVCVDRRDPSSLTSSCSPPLFPDYFWPEDRTKFCSLIGRYQQTSPGSLGKKRKRNCTGTQLGRLCENDKENEEGFERQSTSKKLKKSEEIEMGFLDDGVFVVGDDGLGLEEISRTKLCEEVRVSVESEAGLCEKAGNNIKTCSEMGKINTIVDAVKHEDLGSMIYEIRKRKTAVKERIEYLKGKRVEYFGDKVQIVEDGELSEMNFLEQIITDEELLDLSSHDEFTTDNYHDVEDWLQQLAGGQSHMGICSELKNSGEFEKSWPIVIILLQILGATVIGLNLINITPVCARRQNMKRRFC